MSREIERKKQETQEDFYRLVLLAQHGDPDAIDEIKRKQPVFQLSPRLQEREEKSSFSAERRLR